MSEFQSQLGIVLDLGHLYVFTSLKVFQEKSFQFNTLLNIATRVQNVELMQPAQDQTKVASLPTS